MLYLRVLEESLTQMRSPDLIDLNVDETSGARAAANATATNIISHSTTNNTNTDNFDDSFRVAIEISKREEEERRRRIEQEEDELQRILELSLIEK